jgi:hypothetical protein
MGYPPFFLQLRFWFCYWSCYRFSYFNWLCDRFSQISPKFPDNIRPVWI